MASSPPPRIEDDGLDDLFDYDIDEADLQALDISVPAPKSPPPAGTKNDDLGLDEEVKVRRRGNVRPTVKLDEKKLLGAKGIPKLRKEAPEKLKFKGKGYEYRDAERLLSYYQTWCDQLYPKARFRDTLQIIEKIGHSRTMKWEREKWLQESREGTENQKPYEEDGDAPAQPKEKRPTENGPLEDDDGDLYSMPKEPPKAQPVPMEIEDPDALFKGAFSDSDDDMGGPDDDELEALLAASREHRESTLPVAGPPPGVEMESSKTAATNSARSPPKMRTDAELEDEMDEMMAYMD